MSQPVLYYDDLSPPVRSCLLVIKMLDIEVVYRFVDLFKGAQLQAEFLKINPAHTVPTLVHDDLILTDSHAILMYLCDISTNDARKTLFPSNFKDRLQVMNKLFFDCSILFRRDSDLMSEIVRKGFDNVDLQYHERKILEAYTMMEHFLTVNQTYMVGSNLTIADISLLTTLSTVDLMFPVESESGANEKWPLLCKWFGVMKSLPHYRINQDGLNKLRAVIEKLGKFKFPTPPPPEFNDDEKNTF